MGNHWHTSCSLLVRARDLAEQDVFICHYCTLPLAVLNPTGEILKLNDAFKLYWDVDPEKVLQNPGYNIFDDPGFRSQKLRNGLESAFEGNVVMLDLKTYNFPESFRFKGVKKTRPRPVSICLAPVLREDRLKAVYLFYHDDFHSCNVKNLERQCQQLAAFVGSVSDLKHEINNPLLLIIGNAQLLLAKSGEVPEEAAQKVEKILRGAEKIRQILEEYENVVSAICLEEEPEPVEEL